MTAARHFLRVRSTGLVRRSLIVIVGLFVLVADVVAEIVHLREPPVVYVVPREKGSFVLPVKNVVVDKATVEIEPCFLPLRSLIVGRPHVVDCEGQHPFFPWMYRDGFPLVSGSNLLIVGDWGQFFTKAIATEILFQFSGSLSSIDKKTESLCVFAGGKVDKLPMSDGQVGASYFSQGGFRSVSAFCSGVSGLLSNDQSSTHVVRLDRINDNLDDPYSSEHPSKPYDSFIRRWLTWLIAGIWFYLGSFWCFAQIERGRRLLGWIVLSISLLVFVASGILYCLDMFPWTRDWIW